MRRTGWSSVALMATLAVVPLLVSAACGEEPPDPRFASPEKSIQTLLSAYGLQNVSQEEVQERMQSRQRFELRDEALFRSCFADYEGPRDEGLAGFVFGSIAAGKDRLRINLVQGKAYVYPSPDRTDRSVVLIKEGIGWRISLRDSVPPEVRRRLWEEYARVSNRNRRAGAPE